MRPGLTPGVFLPTGKLAVSVRYFLNVLKESTSS